MSDPDRATQFSKIELPEGMSKELLWEALDLLEELQLTKGSDDSVVALVRDVVNAIAACMNRILLAGNFRHSVKEGTTM